MLLALLLAALTGSASEQKDKAACEKVKQQIRSIQTRMRNGYSAAEGIRLDERIRELKKKRYKLCR
jgi:hypothetical protein